MVYTIFLICHFTAIVEYNYAYAFDIYREIKCMERVLFFHLLINCMLIFFTYISIHTTQACYIYIGAQVVVTSDSDMFGAL